MINFNDQLIWFFLPSSFRLAFIFAGKTLKMMLFYGRVFIAVNKKWWKILSKPFSASYKMKIYIFIYIFINVCLSKAIFHVFKILGWQLIMSFAEIPCFESFWVVIRPSESHSDNDNNNKNKKHFYFAK